MIPILYRSHVLALGENADEVRFIVESAVIAYFGCTQRGTGQKIAGFGYTQIIDICYE
jgi:hypothetical protein